MLSRVPRRRGLPTDGNKAELIERASVLIDDSPESSVLNGAGLGASPTKVILASHLDYGGLLPVPIMLHCHWK